MPAIKKVKMGRPREVEDCHRMAFSFPRSIRRHLLYDARRLDLSIAAVIRRVLEKHYTGAIQARRRKKESYARRKRREMREMSEDLIQR